MCEVCNFDLTSVYSRSRAKEAGEHSKRIGTFAGGNLILETKGQVLIFSDKEKGLFSKALKNAKFNGDYISWSSCLYLQCKECETIQKLSFDSRGIAYNNAAVALNNYLNKETRLEIALRELE